METTAVWDDKTKEFVINTPSELAYKLWITYVSPATPHFNCLQSCILGMYASLLSSVVL